MKIRITYKNDGSQQLGCWAETLLYSGEYISSCADTYKKAKESLLAKIQRKEHAVPPAEEVEIKE